MWRIVLNAATGVAVTPDSLFQIGSITKVWTGTMIMQLVQEGRLTLDTTVAQVPPGLPVGTPDASAEVTVRHLLTHSSGIDGDIFTSTGRGGDCLERTLLGWPAWPGCSRPARRTPPATAGSCCWAG